MKRSRFGIFALLLFVVTLAASSAGAARPLQVWVQADAVRYPGFEAVTQKFEEETGISVELTNIPGGWADLHRKLLANFAAKTVPDVIYGKGYWLHDFAPRGMLLDLTKYWERDKEQHLNASPVFFEHVKAGSGIDGKIYGLPRGQYWYSLGYNKDLFAEAGLEGPPDTWDDLRSYAMKLTDPSKESYGFIMATYTRVDPVFVEAVVDTWTQQAGGSIMEFGPGGKPVYTLAGNEKAREALQFLVDNIYEYSCFAPPSLEGSMDSLIYSGQIGMWWSHGGHISRHLRAAPDLNFSVAVMPKKEKRTTYIADNKFMVTSMSKMPSEAWEYIKFFTGKEAEALFAPYEGHISVWEDNWNLPVYQHDGYAGLIDQLLLEDTLPYRAHAGWEAVRGSIAREIQKVLFQKVSVDEGLASAQREADKALSKVR